MAGDVVNLNYSERRNCSLFDLPCDFFDSAHLVSYVKQNSTPQISSKQFLEPTNTHADQPNEEEKGKRLFSRWSCNTCKIDFESLQDQRSHFKSDFHRFNVKLSVTGKDPIKEEDFDELTGDSLFEDYEISSISGSEDDNEGEPCGCPNTGALDRLGKDGASVRQKMFLSLQSGETVSVWKCLLLDESEDLSFEKNNLVSNENSGCAVCLKEDELTKRLKCLIHEPRDKTHLRIVLLASGGHFAGCVFDGNSVVAHKTFHRYVVRAKAGKKQSSKDATGKAAKSAGASLRRHNEIALKKEVQELLAAWKPYFDASSCIFIYAPSNNRQLFFDGEKPNFSHHNCRVRHVPLTVRRPTLKEAKYIYLQLTHLVYEIDVKGSPASLEEDPSLCTSEAGKTNQTSNEDWSRDQLENKKTHSEAYSDTKCSDGPPPSNTGQVLDTPIYVNEGTPLHVAARSGNAQQTLELLEQGLDPCVKDARGRTPYMLASEKEVRNTFRRFMALNLDKWDWHAANVPSPLTKEMEDSQEAKQATKDAKRKAKSKELKKLRKEKEKAQAAQAALSQSSDAVSHSQQAVSLLDHNVQTDLRNSSHTSEDELKKARAEEREKRAAAAEKRIAALKAVGTGTTSMPSSSLETKGVVTEGSCSCCMVSLSGIVPFHRYHYKYCSSSCMHVHRDMLEDG